MSDFGAFLGKVAGKVMNAANSSQELMCLGKCDKITKHISISYADYELADINSNSNIVDIIESIRGTVYDLVPLVKPLGIGNPYACTCCNKIRLHGGVTSSTINKSTTNLYLKKK